MTRSWLVVPFLVALPALAADPLPLDETPVPVKYLVTRVAPGNPMLLSGETGVRPRSNSTIERRAARGPEAQSLSIEVSPLEDGRLSLRLAWLDIGPDGEKVQWQPWVVVKRGADVELRFDFPGGGRILHVTAG